MFKALLLLTLVAIVSAHSSNWAVVVSGSKGYSNYRHQSDACHAIMLLKKFGIPEENIVTMIYDDVANHPRNPFPGTLFNKPSPIFHKMKRTVDVYADCHIDYSNSDVTPDNFIHVLLGHSEEMSNVGSGKVLESDSDSNVFIFFVDHGATGLVAFPDDELYADQLLSTLKDMHSKNMYEQLVFYLEACESGSMFADLPDDLNIYATTAANGMESSWATYCYPHDRVFGKSIRSCLGDLYSVNFLQDIEASTHVNRETLKDNFDRIKQLTKKSHVMQFGDVTIASEGLSDFFAAAQQNGSDTSSLQLTIPSYNVDGNNQNLSASAENEEDYDSISRAVIESSSTVSSRDSKLHSLLSNVDREDISQELKQEMKLEILEELKHRKFIDDAFSTVSKSLLGHYSSLIAGEESVKPVSFNCLRSVNNGYIKPFCGAYTDYSLQYVKNVVMMCERMVGEGYSQSEAALKIGEEFKFLCSRIQSDIVEF